ncbi:MAG: choice-of-anchor tandem repeat GloVer-containing protein [Candidatus Korobacteraceae bacterium]
MHSNKVFTALSVSLAAILLTSSGWAATQRPIHNFGLTNTDGQDPQAGLIFDAAGNLYGTTYSGGSLGFGTVFKMTPNGSGGWTEKVLHNFGIGVMDGKTPQAPLVLDDSGNLYGTTIDGGTNSVGVVFEMSPNGGGGWTEFKIHNFGNGEDGSRPEAGLILDGTGNLYGTTHSGGTHSAGTVFELTPNGSGGWTERVLHNFGADQDDGQDSEGGLIFDSAGNLYGTTVAGGNLGLGTVFEMTPNGSGGWTEKVLHNFGHGEDGNSPQGLSLIFDGAGNLYGTTNTGGMNNAGTVFEMSPNGSGGWFEKTLHFFGNGNDGMGPTSSLIFDANGNLYGTTLEGGTNGAGVVFEMMPNGSGGWTEIVLHNFGAGDDGAFPQAGVILDGAGNLYGTTGAGGIQSDGTVFEVTP